jgi:soluble lytic murein transglycosylase-like protein
MRNGPSLVLQGTIIGSVVVALLAWLLAANIKFAPKVEVAYAAPAATSQNQLFVQEKHQDVAAEACGVSLSYPESILQWCAIITRFANQVQLPPNLVAAVMLQESGGDSTAYSASGAVGLMQVMPRDGIAATFECINGPCFASRPTTDELLDPSYNVEYGTTMLVGLISKLGDLREALKAYGPMDRGYSYADRVLAIYERYR